MIFLGFDPPKKSHIAKKKDPLLARVFLGVLNVHILKTYL